MNESSGDLAAAIVRYFNCAPLTLRDVALIRAYIVQWIMSDVWDRTGDGSVEHRTELARLRTLALELKDRETIDAWIMASIDFGLDPL